MSNQIFLCKKCGLRFPVTNNALEGKEKCVICGGGIDVVEESENYQVWRDGEKLEVRSQSLGDDFESTRDTAITELNNFQIEVVLDNVRSAWNVGSMFRTADAAGVSKVYVCGISPIPDNDKVKKTGLGAEKVVDWEYCKNGVELVEKLKSEGCLVWAVEYTQESVNLFEYSALTPLIPLKKGEKEQKLVLVMGHEVGGVDPGILRIVDDTVHLPMRGVKNSMNVAVAFGVAVYGVREMI